MNIAKMRSDYDPDTVLTIIKNDDGDIIIDVSGKGEFRIATSGGQLHGDELTRVIKPLSELIDILLEKKL